LHGTGPDVAGCAAAVDLVADAEAAGELEAAGKLAGLADGEGGDVAAWLCVALPPQPLSRRAAAAAVVRTSACLIR
jgi:hypothetical protein